MALFRAMRSSRHSHTGRIVALFAAMLVCAIVFPGKAEAITLIPPSLELGLIPGQESQTSIKLFNEESTAVELYTESRNFTATGETGLPLFDFESEQIGLSTWITVEEGPIVLQPGGRYEVPVSILPPANADPGGHYAAIFFSTTPPTEGQVRISSKVGTLILATVQGDISESGLIQELATRGGSKLHTRLPITFVTRFKNTGNVHLKPAGTITVKNLFGKTTATLDFNTGKGATLPTTTRLYETLWEHTAVNATEGSFWTQFWQEYANERNNLAFGRYTAEQRLTAGATNQVQGLATVSFWVLPWRVVLVWSLVGIIILFVLILLIKRYNTWLIRRNQVKG
ncbi:MAG TPA: hypothetical protein DIS62_04575 [Candidatus Kerfeldbacteria bacterium]|nr:hypothetical protein [Candidatus Kerfeldbacteria bacterium]